MPSQTGSIDLTAQVSANNNAKDYSDTVVDNLEIGGRNLIGRFNWSATTPAQGVDYYTCSGNGTISSNNTDSTTWSFANCQWQLTLAAGTYQFTIEVLTPCETWGSANLQILNSSGTALLSTGLAIFNNGGILVKTLTLSAETTIGIKIKPGKNAVCRFKLEKGTKATDWTPAPEDQEALANSLNPFIVGTQTAATYDWTGNCPELSELKDGQQITYFLPYSVAGSQITASYTTISSGAVTNVGGASLTLTLANNVSSGQIPIWYGSGMSRVTSHYAYGSVLHLTYREDVTMSGTYHIDCGWFADANYNTDTVYSRTLDGGFITGLNGAGSYSLHMKDANGNWTNIVKQYSTNNTHTVYTGGLKFDEVLYNSTWYTNGIVTTSGTSVGGSLWSSYILDFRYSANVVNTDAGKIIARKPVYLVGTVGSDGLFYLDTTKWWTQTLPTSVDNKVYLYIGTGYDWYRINLQDKKTAYIYHDSKIKEYDEYLSDIAAQTATNYITADTNGIKIHMAGNSATYQHQTADSTTFYVSGKKRSQVGADGLHVYVDADETEVAKFTADGARIGKENGRHVDITSTSFDIMNGSNTLATFKDTAVIGQPGVENNMVLYLGQSWGSVRGITEIVRYVSPSSSNVYFRAVYDPHNGNDYVLLGYGSGDYPGYGDGSVAIGRFTASGTGPTGYIAIAEGYRTTASGDFSHAEGYGSIAGGDDSHAQNYYTKAEYTSQTAIGRCNSNGSNNAFEIGNGTSDSARSNALIVDWDGNLIAQGMAGMVQMFAGSTAPTGWLICNGAAVSRTTYATLFAVIGTTWGSGDGSTTFNLPDLRGRAPIGAGTGSGLTARSLAAKTGAETHTLTAAQSGLPAHTHGFTQPTVKTELKFQKNAASGSALNRVAGSNLSNPTETSIYTATVTGGAVGAVTGGAQNASAAHNIMQPSVAINFIICTGKTS